MFNSLLNTSTIPLLEQMASFSERRQEVLAGNVANIDTPDYKMRDLPVADFKSAMKAAVERLQSSGSFASEPTKNPEGFYPQTDPLGLLNPQTPSTIENSASVLGNELDLSRYFPAKLHEAQHADPANVVFRDGSNRSIEHQMMEMTKNSSLQQFSIELMNAQFRTLEAVISERA